MKKVIKKVTKNFTIFFRQKNVVMKLMKFLKTFFCCYIKNNFFRSGGRKSVFDRRRTDSATERVTMSTMFFYIFEKMFMEVVRAFGSECKLRYFSRSLLSETNAVSTLKIFSVRHRQKFPSFSSCRLNIRQDDHSVV